MIGRCVWAMYATSPACTCIITASRTIMPSTPMSNNTSTQTWIARIRFTGIDLPRVTACHVPLVPLEDTTRETVAKVRRAA